MRNAEFRTGGSCALPWAFFVLHFAFCVSTFAQVAPLDPLDREPTWKAPSAAEVREQVFAWLDSQPPGEDVRKQIDALWPADEAAPSSAALLERVVATFSLAEPRYKELSDFAAGPLSAATTPSFPWLTNDATPALVRHHLRLWLGRWLALHRRYDEALAQLDGLKPSDVVDPASLLFYQGACHYWMLHKTEGLTAIDGLLERRETIPRRYRQVAELMRADLSKLEDESLDHIARRMNDVTRRLDFGHAGKQVRTIEDGIIASLDKLIEKMEEQAGQSGGQGDGSGGGGAPRGIRSTAPAQDSRSAEGKGPGEVVSKRIGNRSGWGDLPPKQREEALQQISKEFPSHYRDIIEQYFRKLASEDEEK